MFSLHQHGHTLPEVWSQSSARQLCGWVVHPLPELYPLCLFYVCITIRGGGVRKFVNPELHVTLRVKRLPPWPFFAPYTELHSRLSITSFLTCKLCSLTYPAPAEFLSFYGLLNFYLYTLAFVYSPSKNAVYGKFWCISSVMHLTWNFLHKEIRCCFFCLFFFSSLYIQTPSWRIILHSPCWMTLTMRSFMGMFS